MLLDAAEALDSAPLITASEAVRSNSRGHNQAVTPNEQASTPPQRPQG